MRKIYSVLFTLCLTASVFAQNIATLSIEGALTSTSRRTNGEIQAVVAPGFDFSNVAINYTLDAESELAGTMPVDFSASKSQTVTVKKTIDGTTKDWTITIKQINPTALPFSKTFSKTDGNKTADWTEESIGWAFAGINTAQTGTCRFDNSAISFIVAFNTAPASVSYKLASVSNPLVEGDEFAVEASADGVEWRVLRNFTKAGDLTTTDQSFSDVLKKNDRYVRWVYVKRTSVNVKLNEISVLEAAGDGAAMDITATGYGLKKFSVKNGLQLYTKTASSLKNELELHAVVAPDFDFSNPANNVLEVVDGFTADPAILPTDFSTPQHVTFAKETNVNVWTIYVRSIKPAALPLELSFNDNNKAEWSESTEGWAPAGISSSASRLGTLAFDGSKTGVVFAFTDEASTLQYDLCINAASTQLPSDAVFEILTSDESAANWTVIKRYDAENQIPSSDAESITHQLDLTPEVRYVKFVYTNRGATGGKNLNLNNIRISGMTSSVGELQQNAKLVCYITASGEIVTSQEVRQIELYNLLGKRIAAYSPSTSSFLLPANLKGLILLKVTLNDGTSVTQKYSR